ncbi:MAG: glycoside hydrolase family 2 TIM barrel-domain containing protein, partial [bacterium]
KPWSTECDDSSWVAVSVPHNCYDLGKEMDRFVGTVWYRRKIDIPQNLIGKRTVIHFWGAFYRTDVFVNGKPAGSHEGGYTPFAFDITENIRPGSNIIAIKVNNILEPLDIAMADWWNYGGLHREVFIEFTNKAHIASFHITSELNDSLSEADVKFDVTTENAEGKKLAVFTYRVEDEKLHHFDTVTTTIGGETTIVNLKLKNPSLWSPENPNLYFAKVIIYDGETAVDGVGDTFGIMRFEVRGEAVYLNGQKIFLRGINRHDEMPHGEFPDAGRAMSEEERINDFRLIKELGANAMRTAHYPNHPYNYYITDRLGILTIEEGGPVRASLDDDRLIDKYKQQMREMVMRDRNRPSIVMWSIGNEFGGDKFLKCIRELSSLMRSIDTRALTFTETGHQTVLEGYQYVDVVARNEYYGWYEGTANLQVMSSKDLHMAITTALPPLIEQYHAENPGKPIIIMETGAEAVAGEHASSDERLKRGTEEYQNGVLATQFEVLRKYPYIVGVFPWIFADFKTQRASGTCQFKPHLNQKGLVSYYRQKKLSYFTIQKIYAEIATQQNIQK